MREIMCQNSKVHSQGHVPFSWENEPGVSKLTKQDCVNNNNNNNNNEGGGLSSKLLLPPPPCLTESGRLSLHDIQIPPPPCAFQQPPARSSSRKGLRITINKHDQDPFLIAFKECTKSSTRNSKLPKYNNYASRLKKGMFDFSCKKSCSVRDGNLVRVSRLPCKKDDEEM